MTPLTPAHDHTQSGEGVGGRGRLFGGILSIEEALKRRGIRIGEKPDAQAVLNPVALAPHTRHDRAGRLPMQEL